HRTGHRFYRIFVNVVVLSLQIRNFKAELTQLRRIDKMRLLETAASRQSADCARGLNRSDVNLPLTDGNENGFNGRPRGLLHAPAVLLGRNETGNFLRQIDSRLTAKAGCCRKLRNLVDAQRLAQIVKVNVTGMDNGGMQVDIAMAARFPA